VATIGAAAISRASGFSPGYTIIEESNPASEAFTILRVKIYANVAMRGVEVATFYKTDGNTFSTRNTALIGDIPAGYSDHVVSIGAEIGDYIGCYFIAGELSSDTAGGVGRWYKSGDYIPCTGQVFTHLGAGMLSLGGDTEIPVVAALTEMEVNPTYVEGHGGGHRALIGTEIKPSYFGEGGGGWNVFAETELSPFLPAPEVTTDPALWIGPLSATLDGTLDSGGGIEPCDCGFEWGLTAAYGETTPTEKKETGEGFSQLITGLLPNTTYHFRALATGFGTSNGADRTFVTAAATILATVTTDPVTGRGMIVATINGTLNQDGGEVCECGFEWGHDITYGLTTPTESKITGETFSQDIRGLFPGTVYHYRAFAINSIGTAYGADESFYSKPSVSRAYALARKEL